MYFSQMPFILLEYMLLQHSGNFPALIEAEQTIPCAQ